MHASDGLKVWESRLLIALLAEARSVNARGLAASRPVY